MNEFTQLTIDGVTYVPRDNTKLPKPSANGSDGQVLAKKGDTTEWVDVEAGDSSVTDSRVSLIEGAVTELDEAITGIESRVSDTEEAIGELERSITATEKGIEDLGKANDQLGENIDKVANDLDDANSAIGELEGSLTDLESTVASIKLEVTQPIEYTEFILWANESTVPQGTYIRVTNEAPVILGDSVPTDMTNVVRTFPGISTIDNHTGLVISGSPITPSKTHKLILKCLPKVKTELDVVIDWGDGNVDELSTTTNPNITFAEDGRTLKVTAEHTYDNYGIYYLKIKGNDSLRYESDVNGNGANNLIHKVVKISNTWTNWSNMFNYALRLFKFDLGTYSNQIQFCENFYRTFKNCENMVDCYGFIASTRKITTCGGMFWNCYNMTKTDFRMPEYQQELAYSYTFKNCANLTGAFSDYLPVNLFLQNKINIDRAFDCCEKLTYNSTVADKLWNDPTITWLNTNRTFINCSSTVRAYIPTAWGGTNTQIVETPVIQEQVKVLEEDIKSISSNIDALMSIVGGVEDDLNELLEEV